MTRMQDRRRNRKRRIDGDLSEFILLSLFKEGALTLTEIEKTTALQTVDFCKHSHHQRNNAQNVQVTCDGLLSKNLLKLNCEAKYELTSEGRIKAIETADALESARAENQLLSPSATARNTIVGFVFLAVMKLFAGFLGGSVGLNCSWC
jgi:hypothetical protein